MIKSLRKLVRDALTEDIGQEDVTTQRTVPRDARCEARLVAKQDGVLSGIEVFRTVFDCVHAGIEDWGAHSDGDRFVSEDEIATFKGNTAPVLTGERTAMNFVQHLSGVATLTACFVDRVADLNVKVCDTRKTTPLLRRLEKQAVVDGGGVNHRHTLFNGVVIKENHIVAAGGIREAVRKAWEGTHHLMKIEVEVQNLHEFGEALDSEAGVVLLDNMSLEDMAEAVRRARGHKMIIEASGNVNAERVRAIAETGVDVISVGALTHSAPVADLSLLIENV